MNPFEKLFKAASDVKIEPGLKSKDKPENEKQKNIDILLTDMKKESKLR